MNSRRSTASRLTARLICGAERGMNAVKCSGDTALRDIQILKERGIFIQNPGGGRSTSYRLPDEG